MPSITTSESITTSLYQQAKNNAINNGIEVLEYAEEKLVEININGLTQYEAPQNKINSIIALLKTIKETELVPHIIFSYNMNKPNICIIVDYFNWVEISDVIYQENIERSILERIFIPSNIRCYHMVFVELETNAVFCSSVIKKMDDNTLLDGNIIVGIPKN